MGLRIICIFVVLFIGTNGQTVKHGDDDYEHMLEMISDLQSTVIHLQLVETNLEGVVSKQTTELEQMEEKVEKLEAKQLQYEAIYPLPNPNPPATSCKSLAAMGYDGDGVYTLTVNNSPLQVYCQDKGWTVIQKRTDGSLDYGRYFDQYADGFGAVEAEHWLGLKHMHALTSSGNWTLRFDFTAFSGETAYAEYDEFHIDAGTDYTLWFNKYSARGTAGDSLEVQWGNKFTTPNMDQDSGDDQNCGARYGVGWWFDKCMMSLTTGMPYGKSGSYAIYWDNWKGHEVLKAVTMKIKEY